MPTDRNGNKARKLSFSDIDEDGDGHIELQELTKVLPNVPKDMLRREFQQADLNQDGWLNRHEYKLLLKSRAFRFAKMIILPKGERNFAQQRVDGVDFELNGEYSNQYTDEYTCCPPPLFIPTISLVMIIIFLFHTIEVINKIGWIGINGPPPSDSVLIYNPYKRYEIWRYLTYMFVHSGWMHIGSNLFVQLPLGILLEMVHKWWRVMIVYFAGVISGSLATSISDPKVFLVGASGGVYALITAHLATVIMNWKEMEMPWFRVITILGFIIMDVGSSLYTHYVDKINTNIGHFGHFGGALAGLLIGIVTLRNIRIRIFEVKIKSISIIFSSFLFAFAIGWNIFYI